MQAAVHERVGVGGDETPVRARARVRVDDAGRYTATVDLDGHAREIDADTCRALADAVALLVAIHIDSVRSGAASPPVEPDPERDETRPAPGMVAVERPFEPPAKASSTPIEPTRSRAPTGVLRPEASTQFGIVGPVAGAIGLAGGIRIGLARVEGQLRYVPPHELSIGAGRPSARVQLATIGIAGCVEPAAGRVTFPLCAVLHVGAAGGRGDDGVDAPEPVWRPSLSAIATGGLRVPVARRVALRLQGGPEVLIVRTHFVVGPAGISVHEPGPVGGHVALGVEVDFSSRRRPRPST